MVTSPKTLWSSSTTFAVASGLRRLVTGLSPRRPCSIPCQQMRDLWWIKFHRNMFLSTTKCQVERGHEHSSLSVSHRRPVWTSREVSGWYSTDSWVGNEQKIKLFVNAKRKDFAVTQISLQNLKFPQDSLQNAAFRTAKKKTGLLSSLWPSFYQLQSSICDSAKNNEIPFLSVHHDSWLDVNRTEHAHDMVSYRFRIAMLPTPKLLCV